MQGPLEAGLKDEQSILGGLDMAAPRWDTRWRPCAAGHVTLILERLQKWCDECRSNTVQGSAEATAYCLRGVGGIPSWELLIERKTRRATGDRSLLEGWIKVRVVCRWLR